MDANGTAGADLIRFDIPGSGVHTISLLSPLPEITDAVTIDGSTQPSGTIALDGSGAGAGATGLVIHSGNSVVRGLAINGFNGNGIRLDTNGGNLIEGNQIGAGAGNGGAGVFVNSSNNTIGGLTSSSRNVISQNGAGVHLTSCSSNRVFGNYIGLDA